MRPPPLARVSRSLGATGPLGEAGGQPSLRGGGEGRTIRHHTMILFARREAMLTSPRTRPVPAPPPLVGGKGAVPNSGGCTRMMQARGGSCRRRDMHPAPGLSGVLRRVGCPPAPQEAAMAGQSWTRAGSPSCKAPARAPRRSGRGRALRGRSGRHQSRESHRRQARRTISRPTGRAAGPKWAKRSPG